MDLSADREDRNVGDARVVAPLLTPDMRDLIALFEKHEVRYMVVGGFAVNYYGYVRTTQDIDLLVYPSPGNAARVMRALFEFGFGGAGIPQELFERPGSAVHLGEEPNRIDLLTHLKGIDNDALFSSPVRTQLDDCPASMISFEHLIAAKTASSRARDLADAEELLKSR